MSIEANIAVTRRFGDEILNGRNLEAIAEVFAADYVNHAPGPQPIRGPEGERAFVEAFLAAFPDLHIAIDQVVAQGDLVASRGRFTGRHQGTFMGLPPTDRSVTVDVHNMFRLAHGQIVENWSLLDMLSLLQQLGVVPAPGSVDAGP